MTAAEMEKGTAADERICERIPLLGNENKQNPGLPLWHPGVLFIYVRRCM